MYRVDSSTIVQSLKNSFLLKVFTGLMLNFATGGVEAADVSFGSQQVISTFANRAVSVFGADLDGDGDIDVLSASFSDDKIAWYENTDGLGSFGPEQVITTLAEGAKSVFAADLDGDGDLDVLSASPADNKIAWYENSDGLGSFGPQQVITTSAEGARSVLAADFDGDGDQDVLSGSELDNKVVWYENLDGTGLFGPGQVVTASAQGVVSVFVADLDGDGDQDVLSASPGDDKIAWYENSEVPGTFGVQRVITTSADGAYSVFAADLDGDGDLDVLSASVDDNKIAWYENTDGQGAFGPQQVVTTSAFGSTSVFAADLDGDGDADILSASTFDNTIAWYENTDARGAFGPEQVIAFRASRAQDVFAADLDGDGDLDVLSALFVSSDAIRWYENQTNTPRAEQSEIDNERFGLDRIVLRPKADGPHAVYAADLDGDGDKDAISASSDDNKIAWYENTDGRGAFGPQRLITTKAAYAVSVTAADLDGDGDFDVLSASFDDDKIAWYENTDGKGGFSRPRVITTLADGATSVFAADLNGDGDADVLSASELDHKIAWYENTNGRGAFGPQQVITTSAFGAQSVFAADLDGDGDQDVLSASERDDKVAWYENTDGLGSFGPPQTINIGDLDGPVRGDDGNANGVRSVFAKDLDGDGDLDVLSASFDDDKIAWYENTDGLGAFGPQQVINLADPNADPFDGASGDADGASSVFAADLDGDGDLDVFSTSFLDDKIAWYENTDGLGAFGPQQAINVADPDGPFRGADGDADGAQSVFAADLDGDGDLDILSASFHDDKIAWYENTNGTGAFGAQQAITSVEPQAGGAWSVFAADLDGDGDLDVLTASERDNKIAWLENTDGLGGFGAQQAITTSALSAQSVFAADLDGDGDFDVLSASFLDDKIAWYENTDGLGAFGPQQTITTSAAGAQSVFAADLDGDGDSDILSASSGDDKIAWYENTNGKGAFGPQQVITSSAGYATSVFAVDLDGDGDFDVLSASFRDDKIAWYENLDGLGTFGAQQVISATAIFANAVLAADLDGDGDFDVLSASGGDNKIAWYENTDGMGSFGPQQIITVTAQFATWVSVTDLDGDGDQDVLSASEFDDKIAWYENTDGAGAFSIQRVITTAAGGARAVIAADLDGDGEQDLISPSVSDDKIAWYRNLGPDVAASLRWELYD